MLNENKYGHLAESVLQEFGYIVDSQTNEILYMNKAILDSYDLTEADYKGQKCYDVICHTSEVCGYSQNDILKENEFRKRYHYSELRNQHLALKEKIEIIDGKRCIVITGIDISNEDSKKKELQILSDLDKSIIKCADTLLKETGQSMYELMGILADYYKGEHAYIFELNNTSMTFTCMAEYRTGKTADTKKSLKNIPYNLDSELGKLMSKNEHFYIDTIENFFSKGSLEYEMLRADQTTNILAIPLTKNDEFFGFIGVGELTDYNDDPTLLEAVAAFVVNNLFKNKAVKKMRKTKKELDITFEVTQTLGECAGFLLKDEKNQDSINLLLKTVCNYYGSESAYIFEWDEQKKLLLNDYHFFDPNVNFVEMKDIEAEMLILWLNIVKDKNMFFMQDLESELDYGSVEYNFLKNLGVKSMLLVPLVRDGVKTGLLGCDNLARNFQTPELLYTLAGFIMNDIEKKELINELEVLSYTDKLTGLYNRNYYLHLIETYKKNPVKGLGVVFADVNGLKKSNDSLGHEYGDTLLKWCAYYLKKNLKSSICRIGGDEFICFCENISQENFELAINTMQTTIKGMAHQCMSIGSTWVEVSADVKKQIIETDKLMYEAKQEYYALLKERNLTVYEESQILLEVIKNLENDLV